MRVIRGVIVVLAFALIGAVLAAVITSRADSGDGSYLVRAVFDNSSFVIPGEDVKVAGVKVGTIQAVGLTSNNKAAIMLEIDDPRFEPFRADAHCEIGLESLLGEQFVQCTPSQPVAAGAQRAPVLPSIASGPDKGQHVLGSRTRPHRSASISSPTSRAYRSSNACRSSSPGSARALPATDRSSTRRCCAPIRRCSRPTRRSPCWRARTGCWPD